MINENFINRVIQVLVEMRLDEGIVKRKNKAKKREWMASNAPTDIKVQQGRKYYYPGVTPERSAESNKEYRKRKAADIRLKKKHGPKAGFDDYKYLKMQDTRPKLP